MHIALNPYWPDRPIPLDKHVPLRPRYMTQEDFSNLNDNEIAALDVDCIYLCDVADPTTGDIRRLETHLRKGGGLVFVPGDRVAAKVENIDRLLYKNGKGLLPARLGQKSRPGRTALFPARDRRSVRGTALATVQGRERPGQPALGPIQELSPVARERGVARPRGTVVHAGRPGQEVGPRFSVGRSGADRVEPAVAAQPGRKGQAGRGVAGSRYRGKVVLFTSTLNLDWTRWPGSPSYVAMMQELVRLAVSGKLREHQVEVGQLLEEYLPAHGERIKITLHFPEAAQQEPKSRQTQLVDEVNIFRWSDTDISGLYLLKEVDEPQEYPFAVNVPAATLDRLGSESDLTRMEAVALLSKYPADWDLKVVTHLGDIGTWKPRT